MKEPPLWRFFRYIEMYTEFFRYDVRHNIKGAEAFFLFDSGLKILYLACYLTIIIKTQLFTNTLLLWTLI